ncbi:MAG TPA: GNAT family N-acetyltransferase, partial [Petrimonas sp.]|nr:GNAT family N-acetyltransferase [Petrimonas sp.]
MHIEQLKNIDDTVLKAFKILIPQLIDRNSYPSREELQEILQAGNTFLFIARENDEILGTLSLVVYKIPTGKKAWIEDVVVDENARGKGVAASLVYHALKVAREKGIEKVD